MKQIKKFVDILIKKNIVKNEDKDIIIYGLSVGNELFINVATTIILGVIFDLILESIVFLLAFACIRTYAGGYHCKKALNCYFMSSGILVLVLLITKYIPKECIFIISIILLIVSVPYIIKFAPMGIDNKPLDHMEHIYFRKKVYLHLYIEVFVITILFLVSLEKFAFLVSLAIFISGALLFMQWVYFKISAK